MDRRYLQIIYLWSIFYSLWHFFQWSPKTISILLVYILLNIAKLYNAPISTHYHIAFNIQQVLYFLFSDETWVSQIPSWGWWVFPCRVLLKTTFDRIPLCHCRHVLISMTTWKKVSYLNKKFFFHIIEVFLDSRYALVCDMKGLQTMDDIK